MKKNVTSPPWNQLLFVLISLVVSASRANQEIPRLEKALSEAGSLRRGTNEIYAALELSAAYLAAGQNCAAITLLHRFEPKAAQLDPLLQAKVEAGLGNACLFSHKLNEAEAFFLASLSRSTNDELQGSVRLSLGILEAARQPPPRHSPTNSRRLKVDVDLAETMRFGGALTHFDAALQIATKINSSSLHARILLNRARVEWRLLEFSNVRHTMNELDQLFSRHDFPDKPLLQLGAGELYLEASRMFPELRDHARDYFQRALDVASGNANIRTYALGYLGKVELTRGNFATAEALTYQALEIAQKMELEESTFLWMWQLGSIFKARGANWWSLAETAYNNAISLLEPLRADFLLALSQEQFGRSFRDSVGQVYFERAELLLDSASMAKDSKSKEKALKEAMRTIELLKSVEISEFYMDDDCAGVVQSRKNPIPIPKGSAVIYLIGLADRLEILVNFSTEVVRVSRNVSAADLFDQAEAFRDSISNNKAATPESGRKLWGYIIEPILPELKFRGIDTLVFIPEGPLAMIPMAALHDGENYLVEQFATAICPGLTLMEAAPLDLKHVKPLLFGLSIAINETNRTSIALPKVPFELTEIKRTIGGKIYMNDRFTTSTFERELKRGRHSIVHIASHGSFGANGSQSYIRAFNDDLTADRFEELLFPLLFQNKPIELLVLSACETAAGDERAALGLAGFALKAGALSALATLWSVNDDSTAYIMTRVYKNLSDGREKSRSRALQKSQREVMRMRQFENPYYWAPYVMVGQWN